MSNLLEAHNQWAHRPADQRFSTLAELRAAVHSRRDRSRSVDVALRNIRASVSEDNRIVLNSGIHRSEFTHWSFGQLSNVVGAPAKYLRNLSPELAVENINYGLNKAGNDCIKALTIVPEDEAPATVPRTLQAATSVTYGRIWDADVVDATIRLNERTGNQFRNPWAYAHKGTPNGFQTLDVTSTVPSGLYASDRDVFIFLIDGGDIIDVGDRAKFHRGFFVWNSEVGNATFGIKTFLFNTVCGNNIVWGAKDVNELVIRHTSGGPGRFDREAAPYLHQYIQSSDSEIRAGIGNAQDYLLPEPDELYSLVNKAAKFTQRELADAVDYARREEGECRTLWQLCQGFSAREIEFADARIDLETRAGKLVNIAR